MRLKFDKNDKFRFKKLKNKAGEAEDKIFWNNECVVSWAKLGEKLVFNGTKKNGNKFNWESKTVIVSIAANERGLKVDTEDEIFFFDLIK